MTATCTPSCIVLSLSMTEMLYDKTKIWLFLFSFKFKNIYMLARSNKHAILLWLDMGSILRAQIKPGHLVWADSKLTMNFL